MSLDPGAGTGTGIKRRRPPRLHGLDRPQHNPAAALLPQQGSQDPQAEAPVDLSADPILQQIRAVSQRHIQEAQANELAGRKQALIDYGYDPSMDNLYADDATRQAAKQNPFSVLNTQKHDYEQRTNRLEDNLNKSNLFYSSARGTQLGENARGYQEQQAGAHGQLNSVLGGLAQHLLAAQSGAADDEAGGVAAAFGRYKPPNTGGQAPAADTGFARPAPSWYSSSPMGGRRPAARTRKRRSNLGDQLA